MLKNIKKIYQSIMDRCYNPNFQMYEKYGAKGITVCEEWHDFEAFKSWYERNTIKNDKNVMRIDPSQGYSPRNCYLKKIRGYTPEQREMRKHKRDYSRILNYINTGASEKQNSPLWVTWVGIRQRCQNPNRSN